MNMMNTIMTSVDTTDMDITALLQDGIFEYSSSEESSVGTLSPKRPKKETKIHHDTPEDEKQVSYLEKLYTMLNECPPSVATWTQNGTAFAIYDPESLEKVIIPQHFQPIKFESFVRQLNSYRFKKSKFTIQKKIVLEFQHSNFVQGRRDLLMTIKRRRRIRRKGPKTINEMNDSELRTAMIELVKFVQTLHSELIETKEIAKALFATKVQEIDLNNA